MSNERELNAAVSAFMEARCVKTQPEQKAEVPESATGTRKNLLIGIPAFGGSVDHSTVNMLMILSRLLDREKISHTVLFVANESLIPRARNYLASVAAFSNDHAGNDFDSLLFVDADLSFDARWVIELLKCELPIVALPYSRKSLNWNFISEAAAGHGIAPEHLSGFGGSANFAIDDDQVFEVGQKPVRVRHAATGAMLVDVRVFRALTEAFPERRYRPNCNGGSHVPITCEWNFDFFRVGVRKEIYLSEDFAFCEDALELGFGTYLLPSARTFHQGAMSYEMDLSKVSAVAAAIERKQATTTQSAGDQNG